MTRDEVLDSINLGDSASSLQLLHIRSEPALPSAGLNKRQALRLGQPRVIANIGFEVLLPLLQRWLVSWYQPVDTSCLSGNILHLTDFRPNKTKECLIYSDKLH
jgi:hypothetical protein